MKNKTINALLEMGMPADIKGFRYITEIMCLYDNDNKLIGGNLMGVYETIAKQNDTTVSRVERALRHAYSSVRVKGDLKMVEEYLTMQYRNNGALLATLYYRLKMEEKK